MTAYKAGADVVVLSFARSQHKERSSWDHFYTPPFFRKGGLVIGNSDEKSRYGALWHKKQDSLYSEAEKALNAATQKVRELAPPLREQRTSFL